MGGPGEGFAQGVQMAGSYLMPALQMRMQNNRFNKQLAQRDKQYYDRMTLDQAWKEGFYGGPSMFGGGPSASMQPNNGLAPYQVTRNQTPGEALAGQFTDPNPGYRPDGGGTPPKWTHPNPPSPAAALATPPIGIGRPIERPGFKGPSPSSTPFSTASPNPYMEQRTFAAPKDPSMVIKSMPEVTHEAPNLMRISPGTPLPPQSIMRPQPFRQSFQRGF